MRHIVTGAAGFLGSHLVDRLVARGDHVVAVDNLRCGMWDNIDAPVDRWTRIEGDASFVDTWNDAMIACDVQADYVWHLAAIADPDLYTRLPVDTLVEQAASINLACAMSRIMGSRLVFTSTSEVYGDPEVSPQPETYAGVCPPQGPRSMYDEGKRYSEAVVAAYRSGGLDARVVRLFNSYGHRISHDDGRVVSTFVRRALAGKTLQVHGDGNQTRSFCHWTDTLSGLLLAADVEHDYDAVNVGTANETSIRDLARIVCEVVQDVGWEHVEPRPGDPQRRRPDNGRLRSLGWKPKMSLYDGIADMADRLTGSL